MEKVNKNYTKQRIQRVVTVHVRKIRLDERFLVLTEEKRKKEKSKRKQLCFTKKHNFSTN